MDKKSKIKILCVDDEDKVLSGIKLQLREHYRVSTATSGKEALELMQTKGPFAIVVSDMRMPEMNGATFLAKAKSLAPNTTRILLTGQSDIESAMAAINQGQIFRFLMKPCPKEDLLTTLQSAYEHHRLLHVEKELLEKTLQGSIQVLTDILSLVKPVAFSQSTRISRYVKFMAETLPIKNKWTFNIAAMLANIGHLTVPSEILEKMDGREMLSTDEKSLLQEAHTIAFELVRKIPRLKPSAEMIQQSQKSYSQFPDMPLEEIDPVHLGAQMLRIARDVNQLVTDNATLHEVISNMMQQSGTYNLELLNILHDYGRQQKQDMESSCKVNELTTHMIIDQNITSSNGALLISKGQPVTDAICTQLNVIAQNGNLTATTIKVITQQ